MTPPINAPDADNTRANRAHYTDKCALIDRYLGRLFDTLKKRNLYDNTVIIFSSDHGDNLGDYGIWDKRFFYEQSVGVPLIMAGPGVAAGVRNNGPRVSKTLISHLDLYPTILTLAHADTTPAATRPGLDITAMLREDKNACRTEVFSQLATNLMIRTGNWKLVFDPEAGGVQYLFNLAVDPHETQNLAGIAGYEAVTLDLTQRCLAHHIRLHQFTHVKEEQRLQRVHTPNWFL
jgi:choline-sulfatase